MVLVYREFSSKTRMYCDVVKTVGLRMAMSGQQSDRLGQIQGITYKNVLFAETGSMDLERVTCSQGRSFPCSRDTQ